MDEHLNETIKIINDSCFFNQSDSYKADYNIQSWDEDEFESSAKFAGESFKRVKEAQTVKEKVNKLKILVLHFETLADRSTTMGGKQSNGDYFYKARNRDIDRFIEEKVLSVAKKAIERFEALIQAELPVEKPTPIQQEKDVAKKDNETFLWLCYNNKTRMNAILEKMIFNDYIDKELNWNTSLRPKELKILLKALSEIELIRKKGHGEGAKFQRIFYSTFKCTIGSKEYSGRMDSLGDKAQIENVKRLFSGIK